MRLLKLLTKPITLLFRILLYPLQLRSRRRVLEEGGWTELVVEGEVSEVRHTDRVPHLVRRLLRRTEPPRVTLSRLRRFCDEMIADPHARGVLVRVGALKAGWAASDEIRRQLLRLREAGREVVVQVKSHAGNHELLVASAASRLLMTPSGALAATGAASHGLFLKDALAHAGVRFEVAAKGRFKSAPDRFTRSDRSEFDEEQQRRILDTLDGALADALTEGRGVERAEAEALLDEAPLVGTHALAGGHVDGLARDEDLPEQIRTLAEADEAPTLVGAGTYLEARTVRSPLARRKKRVGVVRVHGAIVDQAPRFSSFSEQMAVEKQVVADLRTALSEREIGAVILHVDSRGGSVTASDAIFSAVKRLDAEKPVIACFSDFAASGGYYVACGARAIVAAPLTITGSIGVFAMLPTWPQLAEKLSIHHDVLANHKHAGLFDPWRGLDDEARAVAGREVDAMYESFVDLVADARSKTRDEIHGVAEGRVWMGNDAKAHGLVDDLGGFEAAMDRARDEAGGGFEDQPVLIHARGPQSRPNPLEPTASPAAALQAILPPSEVFRELVTLCTTGSGPFRALAYLPLELR